MAADKFRGAVDVLASICVITLAVLSVWLLLNGRQSSPPKNDQRQEPAVPLSPVSLQGAATKGSSDAKVGMLIYSDFQCPYCGRFARDTMPTLEREYVASQRVFLAFRNLPLVTIHPLAARAAQAVSCARSEGRFWDLHDRLFGLVGTLSESAIAASANEVGLTGSQFRTCMSSSQDASVLTDLADAKALGIGSTPTFLIGIREGESLRVVRRVSGAKDPDDFRKILNEILRTIPPHPGL